MYKQIEYGNIVHSSYYTNYLVRKVKLNLLGGQSCQHTLHCDSILNATNTINRCSVGMWVASVPNMACHIVHMVQLVYIVTRQFLSTETTDQRPIARILVVPDDVATQSKRGDAVHVTNFTHQCRLVQHFLHQHLGGTVTPYPHCLVNLNRDTEGVVTDSSNSNADPNRVNSCSST